ncbi:TPA: GIY-YIG nuclease family protein [Neisseria meningitidis]
MNASNWSVYLILCENSAFYCGISPNPQHHASGKGAKYTRVFKPVAMRIVAGGMDKGTALRQEIAVKKLTAAQKRQLWEQAEKMPSET